MIYGWVDHEEKKGRQGEEIRYFNFTVFNKVG